MVNQHCVVEEKFELVGLHFFPLKAEEPTWGLTALRSAVLRLLCWVPGPEQQQTPEPQGLFHVPDNAMSAMNGETFWTVLEG